ncbi:DUF2442 domain-containing protein, partial [Rosenbergiella epipactidis]|uniref:DUF2442 domain-containing protein n=1 Tax=Rosenbergiella epipactidis TaxID=1544694 RepID=UPI001F4D4AD2
YTEKGLIALEFSDGNKGVFNLSVYLSECAGSLLQPLNDEDYARRCFIDAGALCWPNGLELSAERLKELVSLSKAA